jgi:hypothetical protein
LHQHGDNLGNGHTPHSTDDGFIIVLPVAAPDPCGDADSEGVPDGADPCPTDSDCDDDGLNDLVDWCPTVASADNGDPDADALGNPCDANDDGDHFTDATEVACGSSPLSSFRRPERIDGSFAGTDDDGDTLVNEALPPGSEGFDCDGDGYIGTDEDHVYAPSTVADQDPCGTNVNPPTVPASPIGWPADLWGGGIPNSTNRVNLLDLTSFLGPVRYINTDVGDHAGDLRWDLNPGPGIFGFDINLHDMTGLYLRTPAMFGGGVRALNGPLCPWNP